MSQISITKKNLKNLQNASKEFDILADTIHPFLNEANLKIINHIQSTLKLSFVEPITFENLTKIESLSPDFHSLSQRLDGFHEKFVSQIENTSSVINVAFKKYREKEEDLFDNKMDGFRKIQEKNKLSSVWSEYDISPKDMKKPFSDKPVESLSYESWGPTQTIKHGKIATWFDMWKLADQIMRQSGDTHHIFIEAFVEDKKKPGHFKLVTGS